MDKIVQGHELELRVSPGAPECLDENNEGVTVVLARPNLMFLVVTSEQGGQLTVHLTGAEASALADLIVEGFTTHTEALPH